MEVRLNLKDLEISIRLVHISIFEGTVGLKHCFSMYSGDIGSTKRRILDIALSLIENGELPEIIRFIITQEIEKTRMTELIDCDELLDLKALRDYIFWIQTGGIDYFNNLIKYISDKEVKNSYSSWIYLNRFDWKLKIEDVKRMTAEEIEKLIMTKPERRAVDFT